MCITTHECIVVGNSGNTYIQVDELCSDWPKKTEYANPCTFNTNPMFASSKTIVSSDTYSCFEQSKWYLNQNVEMYKWFDRTAE